MTTIGYIGDELTLIIRQGCDFETVEVTYVDPNDLDDNGDPNPVDLTGCTPRGAIADQYGVKKADLTLALSNPTGGKYTIDIVHAESAKLIALDKSSSLSRYQWQVEVEDADGKIKPHWHGPFLVQRDIVP